MEKGSVDDLQSRPRIEEEALEVNDVDVKESLRFEDIPRTTPRPQEPQCKGTDAHKSPNVKETDAPMSPNVKETDAPMSPNTSHSTSDCEVMFGRSMNGCAPKNGHFLLAEQDIQIITSGQWLTDHIIGAAHSVLQNQFPYAKGMENTT